MANVKNTKTEKNTISSIHQGNTFAVKQPWISEKSYNLSTQGRYVFLVDKHTNKNEVKKAIKEIYKVDPVSVNMITLKKKPTRFGRNVSSGKVYKKAVITLKQGQTLDIMPS